MKINIERIIKKVKIQAYNLDHRYQNHRIQRSGVNLHLMHLIRSEKRNSVFPGKMINGNLELRDCGISINIDELTQAIGEFQRKDATRLTPALENILKRPDMRNADDVMVRLAALCNPIRQFRTDLKKFSEKMPLTEQIEVLEEYDRQITVQLARWLNIDESPASLLHLPPSSAINPFYLNCLTYENDCLTIFRNEAGAGIYYVVRKKLHGHMVELPVTNYICGDGEEFPVYRMPDLENGGMFPLYGLDKLADLPTTPVILTDILEIASEFNRISEDIIVTSFYGGKDAIPKTDIRPLIGSHRKNYWMLLNSPGCLDESATYRAGLKMLMNFRKYDRDLSFIEPRENKWHAPKNDNLPYACKSDFREISLNKFLSKCQSLGIRLPNLLDYQEIEIISGSQANLVEDDKSFLAPIAYQGGFVILYAAAKAGKTFLALHTALAMSYGLDPIPGYWTNTTGKPQKSLYISGEMKTSTYKKRKLREEAVMKPAPELMDNINFIHEKALHIDDPDTQHKLDRIISEYKPNMIVFDNWQTLSSDSTSRYAFDAFWRWIRIWCDDGITVFLINHLNKNGKILGSGAQPGACDTAVQLYQASNDDMIRILISTEEHRDGKNSLFKPILATFDFDNPEKPDWIFNPMSDSNVKAIKEWNESGCPKDGFPNLDDSNADSTHDA